MNVNFKKTRISLLALALIVGLSACNKPAETDADASQANTNTASGDAEKAVDTNKGVAYVTSQDAGVSVIDLATMKVVKTFDVKAKGPRGLGVTDDGKKLIVATRENESISVIDTTTGEVLQQIPVGKNPEFVRVSGNFAYISSEPSAKGGPPPKPGSAEAEEDENEEKIPARIAVVDLALGKKVRDIVGGSETEGIEFSADGSKLVITNEADNTVTVHDIASGKLLKTIKTHEYGDRPRGIKVSPDGNTYLATLEYGNKFMVLDKDFNFVRTVPTGDTPYGIAYDASGKNIYVASNKSKTLEVYDAKTYEKIKEAPTGNRCWHFSFTPDNKQILLACGKSDAVLVYDAETLAQTGQIEVKNLPWGLVTYPKAMGSLDAVAK